MSESSSWDLPLAGHADTVRTLYVFGDGAIRIGDVEVPGGSAVVVRCDVPATVTEVASGTEVLMLQGRPIAEPVIQYGPFVMNTKAEIAKAYHDYNETGFGGWPWKASDPNHGHDLKRFARHADGKVEEYAAK